MESMRADKNAQVDKPAEIQPEKVFLPNELKDYVRYFQVPTRRWWWGLIALVVGTMLFVLALSLTGMLQSLLPREGEWAFPLALLTNSVAGGSLGILVVVLVSRLFYRQGFGWISSVEGRFRWKWFGMTAFVFAAGIILFDVVMNLAFPELVEYELSFRPYTWGMIVIILLTTPLNAAMEEYFFRGLFARIIAAIVPLHRVGLILSALISTGVFMLLHTDSDLFRNIYYLSMGFLSWWLVYRTGGIEASVAYHAIVNVVGQSILPFMDLSLLSNSVRGDAWSAINLIPIVMHILLVLIVDRIARRKGLVRMSSPSASVT